LPSTRHHQEAPPQELTNTGGLFNAAGPFSWPRTNARPHHKTLEAAAMNVEGRPSRLAPDYWESGSATATLVSVKPQLNHRLSENWSSVNEAFVPWGAIGGLVFAVGSLTVGALLAAYHSITALQAAVIIISAIALGFSSFGFLISMQLRNRANARGSTRRP
jgi:hypothetical protein